MPRNSNMNLKFLTVFSVWLNGIFVALLIPVLAKVDFWGDDFINMTQFRNGLGDLSRSDGKVVANVYWYLAGLFFGNSSAVPYILVNMAVAIVGISFFSLSIRNELPKSFNLAWLFVFVFSSGVIFPIFFWSSNIVHSFAIFFLGLGSFFLEKLQREERGGFLSIACGLSWFMLPVSNPLYIGALVIPIFTSSVNLVRNRHQRRDFSFFPTLIFSLLSVIFFLTIALPRTRQQQPYSKMSVSYIKNNLDTYFGLFANNRPQILFFLFILGAIFLWILISSLSLKSYTEPLMVLASFGIILPILVQGQQTGIHYFTIPILLGTGVCLRLILRQHSTSNNSIRMFPLLYLLLASLALILGTHNVRNWFVTNPYGFALKEFRQQVSTINIEGRPLCIVSGMKEDDWQRFKGGMANELGFAFYPISNSRVEFQQRGNCSKDTLEIKVVSNVQSGTYFVEKR